MGRISGQLKSSVNAGQLSMTLDGKVNLKQYYSGARRMKGVEPIPQSGFRLLPGSAYCGSGAAALCAHGTLKVRADLSYTMIVTVGSVAIWRNDRVKVATLSVPGITAQLIPQLSFYGEANTFGIFAQDIWNGIRLFRNASDDTMWTVGAWPYGDLPEVDLGGTYPKTADKWQFYIRFTSAAVELVMSLTIEGNTTNSVTLRHAGVSVEPDDAVAADWHALAADLQTQARLLSGMTNDLTITFDEATSSGRYKIFNVTFDGALKGDEYQFDAAVLNTTEVSVLSSHRIIGKTEGEPLVSAAKGGFTGSTIYQDRQTYFGAKAKPSAIAMSRTGEYFDLDVKSQNDAAARLENLRTETSEQILHMFDATYLVAFTDRAEYFASNRTIKRNEPLNWVRASTIGSRPGCPPVSVEGYVYFVSSDGGRLYRVNYDAVSETFTPVPVNDLNGVVEGDLVRDITFMAVQRKSGRMASDRLWMLRGDGRLIAAIANVSEDIRLAASEWPVAGGGFVRGLSVDGLDQVWLTIERNGVVTTEILEEEAVNLFQSSLVVNTDLAGQAAGLAIFNGKTVWAEIAGDIHGPFTVSGGAIQTEMPSQSARVGLWTPPIFESMPFVRVLQNDDVVRRPGKVTSVRLYLMDTASIAIGANGQPPVNQPLERASDDLSAPKPNFTGHLPVAGLIGACMDPTLVISQTRPGRLQVRDYIPGVRL